MNGSCLIHDDGATIAADIAAAAIGDDAEAAATAAGLAAQTLGQDAYRAFAGGRDNSGIGDRHRSGETRRTARAAAPGDETLAALAAFAGAALGENTESFFARGGDLHRRTENDIAAFTGLSTGRAGDVAPGIAALSAIAAGARDECAGESIGNGLDVAPVRRLWRARR